MKCSFCDKTTDDVNTLFVRDDPFHAICDECVYMCVGIIAGAAALTRERKIALRPHEEFEP